MNEYFFVQETEKTALLIRACTNFFILRYKAQGKETECRIRIRSNTEIFAGSGKWKGSEINGRSKTECLFILNFVQFAGQ